MHMNGKERRHRAIADLIRAGALSSQEELAERLSDLGYAVTQATISRDLEQIGAVKVRREGSLRYALRQAAEVPRFAIMLRDFVRSIDTAANLVVIKTPPGSAHMIGVALDQAELTEIVGTICGDDTVFVACPSGQIATELAGTLRAEKAQAAS